MGTVCYGNEFIGQKKIITKDIHEVGMDNIYSQYSGHDLSNLWLNIDNQTLGFFGKNKQHMLIIFDQVKKKNKRTYSVSASRSIDSNDCQFKGEINVKAIHFIDDSIRKRGLKIAKENSDIELINRMKYPRGIILSTYDLRYHSNSSCGYMNGIIRTNIYFKNNQIYYDDLDKAISDSFSNNSSISKCYLKTKEKSVDCHWGQWRIPMSGDLDIGAGEFIPNNRYYKYGWKVYRNK